MPRAGRRHRLILYTYTLDRWRRAALAIGVLLLAAVAVFAWLPSLLPGYTPPQVPVWILWLCVGMGAFAVLLAIFLVILRKSAYVQPFDTHLRLVTPLLRMNISYRRFIQTSNAEMGRLFPPEKLKGWRRAFLRPLAKHTVIVLEMKGWPLPRRVLNLFLSPFFFPDRTARLALLVPDWMSFSTELESFRSSWFGSLHPPVGATQSILIANLSGNR